MRQYVCITPYFIMHTVFFNFYLFIYLFFNEENRAVNNSSPLGRILCLKHDRVLVKSFRGMTLGAKLM